MLDSQTLEQLTSVFKKLERPVTLLLNDSSHEKQGELEEMLNQIASTSDKIIVKKSNVTSRLPHFELEYNNKKNGIQFTGIPGGHEFTSVVLAILNSDQKGKLPDESLVQRIQRIRGPIDIKTYISLSCENCPEVVQALNLMAIFHSDFRHEMIDGGLDQEEVQALGIQGVPSVVHNEKLLSAGKSNLAELIKKLESHFGIDESQQAEPKDLGQFDVVVVGGGPAGASSAIYSARKGLKTVVIAERLGGQVQDTKGIENLISVPYTEGPQLSAQLGQHMKEYDIRILEHRRVEHIEGENIKTLQLDSGESLSTKSIIVATGAKWRELGIPGEKQYLGKGVAFCPHCDGPYYKGKDIAVIGGGNSGVEAAIDLAGIVKSVVVVEFAPELKADDVLVRKLKAMPNVSIITNARTNEIIGNNEKVVGLQYEDRKSSSMKTIELDGVFVQIGLTPNSQFIKNMVETNKFGEIVVDQKGRTNVKGIYAAGDVTTTPYKQIIIAMGEGAKAALAAFEDQMLTSSSP